MKRFLFLPLLMMLSSCASQLSAPQCANMDWEDQGYQNASFGMYPANLSEASRICAGYNIPGNQNLIPPVNKQAYQAGWREGAVAYCSPDYSVGYTDGIAGKPKNVIYQRMPLCLRAQLPLNLKKYNQGRKRGLELFCTYENGVYIALQGRVVAKDLCPSRTRDQFNAGWLSGKEKFCHEPSKGFAFNRNSSSYYLLCSKK